MPRQLTATVRVPDLMLASTEAVIATIAESVRQLFPVQYVDVDWGTFDLSGKRHSNGDITFEAKVWLE